MINFDQELIQAGKTVDRSFKVPLLIGGMTTLLRRDPNRLYASVSGGDGAFAPFYLAWNILPDVNGGFPIDENNRFYEFDVRESGSLCQGELICYDANFSGGDMFVTEVRLPSIALDPGDARSANTQSEPFPSRVNEESLSRLRNMAERLRRLNQQIRNR